MTKKTIKLDHIKTSEEASLYTIIFENNDLSEFSKFINRFKDNSKLQRDYQLILYALKKILDNGALERYFRPEGKYNDRVCALPIDSGKLRLYCLRISDKILVLGNGGIKATRTYNEDSDLNGYVMDLQQFDVILKEAVKDGSIQIEETNIIGSEDKIFEL